MKKAFLFAASMATVLCLASCGGNKKAASETNEVIVEAHDNVPSYKFVNNEEIDLASFPKDEEGYYVIFNGKDFTGWRGYLKDHVPTKWVVEDGCIKFNGNGGGEAQQGDGGDLIFCKQFQNFEVKFDWKVEKGSNSGVFYLAKEVEQLKTKEGEEPSWEKAPIFYSAPEYQILDNANHPDAKLGKTIGIRQSSSLYDMIIAEPQNQNPYGEWNTGSVMVYQGTVIHNQNGANVVEYHLWTPEWADLLNSGKFSATKNPLAFELLNECGGPEHKGYFGFQDHGDVVYYKNIRIKIYE